MGSITVDYGNGEVQHSVREIVECNSCGETHPEEFVEDGFCSNCEEETEWEVLAEEIDDYSKYVWSGADSIEEMATRLETRAKRLRCLKMEGFSLREPIRDGHATLRREK